MALAGEDLWELSCKTGSLYPLFSRPALFGLFLRTPCYFEVMFSEKSGVIRH